MSWLYLFDDLFLVVLVSALGWLLYLARVHDSPNVISPLPGPTWLARFGAMRRVLGGRFSSSARVRRAAGETRR
jgi:hypothetical protein